MKSDSQGDEMTAKELATIVQIMRTAQRNYFRTRSTDTLDDCKTYERQVDLAVAAILRTKDQTTFTFDAYEDQP